MELRREIRRSRRYLGSRCIVSFGSDVKFRVELPGGFVDIVLQPRVPVVTRRPPGDVSRRHQQTQFPSLKGRWRRRRRRGRRCTAATAAAAEGDPTSRIQVDDWRAKREMMVHPGTYTSRHVSRAHLANCKMRVFLNPGWTILGRQPCRQTFLAAAMKRGINAVLLNVSSFS